jgi:hypothetical protein
MLNPRKNMRRKAPDETGFDHPVVFPRRLRAACFSAIGVTTAVALIIVGLFANVGLSFLPVPGLGLPDAPTPSAVGSGHALSATGGNGGSNGGIVSAGGVAFAPATVPGGTVATEGEAPTFSTTAGDSIPASSAATRAHAGVAAGIGASTSVDKGSKATGENGKATGGNGGGKSGGKGSSTPTTPVAPPPAEATAPTEEATAVLAATGSSGSGEGAEPGSGESSESSSGGRPGKSTSTTKPGESEGEAPAEEEAPVEEEPPAEEEAPVEEPPAVEAPEPGEGGTEGEPPVESEPPAETTEPPAETPAPVEEVPAEPGETPPVPPTE